MLPQKELLAAQASVQADQKEDRNESGSTIHLKESRLLVQPAEKQD